MKYSFFSKRCTKFIVYFCGINKMTHFQNSETQHFFYVKLMSLNFGGTISKHCFGRLFYFPKLTEHITDFSIYFFSIVNFHSVYPRSSFWDTNNSSSLSITALKAPVKSGIQIGVNFGRFEQPPLLEGRKRCVEATELLFVNFFHIIINTGNFTTKRKKLERTSLECYSFFLLFILFFTFDIRSQLYATFTMHVYKVKTIFLFVDVT